MTQSRRRSLQELQRMPLHDTVHASEVCELSRDAFVSWTAFVRWVEENCRPDFHGVERVRGYFDTAEAASRYIEAPLALSSLALTGPSSDVAAMQWGRRSRVTLASHPGRAESQRVELEQRKGGEWVATEGTIAMPGHVLASAVRRDQLERERQSPWPGVDPEPCTRRLLKHEALCLTHGELGQILVLSATTKVCVIVTDIPAQWAEDEDRIVEPGRFDVHVESVTEYAKVLEGTQVLDPLRLGALLPFGIGGAAVFASPDTWTGAVSRLWLKAREHLVPEWSRGAGRTVSSSDIERSVESLIESPKLDPRVSEAGQLRNLMEPRLRRWIELALRISYATAWTARVYDALPRPRRNQLSELGGREVMDKLLLSELIAVLDKHWEAFKSVSNQPKERRLSKEELLSFLREIDSFGRPDCHAGKITSAELERLRIIYDRLTVLLDTFNC